MMINATALGFAACFIAITIIGILADWYCNQARELREHNARLEKRFSTWRNTEWNRQSDAEIRLLQRISDLEAERDMFADQVHDLRAELCIMAAGRTEEAADAEP